MSLMNLLYDLISCGSQAHGPFDWTPPPDFTISFDSLRSELFIGGVYVRLYLKNPAFPLRAPKEFLEGLLKAYLAGIAEESAASQDRSLLLSAAAAELLRHHQGLAEHAVTLGYVTRLLKLIATRLERGTCPSLSFQGFRALSSLSCPCMNLMIRCWLGTRPIFVNSLISAPISSRLEECLLCMLSSYEVSCQEEKLVQADIGKFIFITWITYMLFSGSTSMHCFSNLHVSMYCIELCWTSTIGRLQP